jgi:hypothetical protein
MPKERAMRLDALQQNEKAEQKKQLMARRAQKKGRRTGEARLPLRTLRASG